MYENVHLVYGGGFEPTTFRTGVSSHNHLTRAPTLGRQVLLMAFIGVINPRGSSPQATASTGFQHTVFLAITGNNQILDKVNNYLAQEAWDE